MGRGRIVKIWEIITISDYLTLVNIVLGMLALILQDFRCVYLAVVFDGLDGYIARRTNTVTEFGAQLDSICDIVSFGVAPAYLLYHYFGGTWSLIASIIYLLSGALRLARFNVLNVRDFIGLPIPAGALLLSTSCEMFLKLDLPRGDMIISILGVLTGFLMISEIVYPKYLGRWPLIPFGVSLALSLFNIPEGLFLCALGYTLYGLFRGILHAFPLRQKGSK